MNLSQNWREEALCTCSAERIDTCLAFDITVASCKWVLISRLRTSGADPWRRQSWLLPLLKWNEIENASDLDSLTESETSLSEFWRSSRNPENVWISFCSNLDSLTESQAYQSLEEVQGFLKTCKSVSVQIYRVSNNPARVLKKFRESERSANQFRKSFKSHKNSSKRVVLSYTSF